jgi:outer membrane biosynthesis protein TonB
MYFDFGDGHPDLERVPSALTAREGVMLSIIVHLAIALVAVILPETEWWKARQAARLAEVERQQQAVVERQRDNPRFLFVQPRVELEPRTPPRPEAPLSDRDRTAVTREATPVPSNPQPRSRGNSFEMVEPSPPPAPPQVARNPGPVTPPAPPSPPAQARADNAAQAPDTLRLPGTGNVPRREDTPPGGRTAQASSPLGQALQNLSRYAEQAAYEDPNGGGNNAFGPAIQFDTKGVEFGPWIRRFVAQVKRNWFVPYAAMSLKGHVVITFNVHKSGAITDLTVIGPASVDSFNNAAFNALAASNPTEPLPGEYPSDKAFFTVTFYYNEPPPTQ